MKKVSVCMLLTPDIDYWQVIYFFERIGFALIEKPTEYIIKGAPKEYIKTIYGNEVELILGYTQSSNQTALEHCKNIYHKTINVTGKTKYTSLNTLFSVCQHDYICVLGFNVFPQKNWLTEILYYYGIVKNSGIVSICDDISDAKCVSLICNEDEHFINVIIPESNYINNEAMYVFSADKLKTIGGFDTKSHIQGYEFAHLQVRYTMSLMNNYYIPNQSVLAIQNNDNIPEENLHKGKLNYEAQIKVIKKQRNFFVPLITTEQ